MYRDEILDLYNNPRNTGNLKHPDLDLEGENPSCGDHLNLFANLKDGKLSEIRHKSEACAICTASTSILTEEVEGLSIDEIEDLDQDWMLEKLGIDVSPMRMKCALLGLKTLKRGLK